MIFLTVKNDYQLKRFIGELDSRNIKYSVFREPDIGNEITAVSFVSNEETDKLTRKFSLLK